MSIDTKRIRLLATSLALAAFAFAVLGIILFQIGILHAVASPAALRLDGQRWAAPGPAPDLEPASPAAASLEIAKVSDVDTVHPGDTLTYTITITNTGDQDATAIVVTDTLPFSTTFIGGAQGWARVGSTPLVTFQLDALRAGYTKTLTLTAALTDAVPAALQYITNTVMVADDTGASAGDTDVNAVDATPALALRKTGALTEGVPGATLTYTIAITNTGDREATGVLVTDTLPAWTSYQDGTPGWEAVSALTETYTCTLGSLPGLQRRTLTLTARLTDTVPAGLEAITNTAEVADDTGVWADDRAVTQVLAAPGFQISKADPVDAVQPGDVTTYTITVTNTGNQDATGVVITDTLPPVTYTQFITASHDLASSGTTLVWSPFHLLAGDSVTRTITLAVEDPYGWPAGIETITNTVHVADDRTNGFTATVTATDANHVDAGPDLFIAKERKGAGSVKPGEVVVYELTYLNKGSQNATGVAITETVPHFVTYNAAASTAGWQAAAATGVYTFSLGDLPVGTGGAIDFAVTVSDTLPAGVGLLTNTARIADDGTSGPDLNPGDNVDDHAADVDAVPDLAAEKDDGLDAVGPGQLITYTLTISNIGSQGATGVLITDTLPASTGFVAASHDGLLSDGRVVWDGLALPAGHSLTRTLTVQMASPVPAAVDAITNTVCVADDGLNGPDPDLDDNIGRDVNPVEALPVVALIKDDGRATVKPGDVLTYTLTAKNVGKQDAAGLIMTDTLPAHTTFLTASHDAVLSDGVVLWTGIQLPVAAEVQRTLTVRVDKPLPPGVTVVANAAEIAGAEGVYDSAQDVNHVLPVVDLVLTKDDGRESVEPGDLVTYTLTVTNAGTAAASGIVLTDTLPAHTAFITASHQVTLSEGAAIWSGFSLVAGGSQSRTLTVRVAEAVPASVETITNTASVADDGTYGPDLDPADNTDVDVNLVAAEALLSIAKTDGRDSAKPGEVLTYTITVSNTGVQDASGVLISDTLPQHVTFVSASGGVTPVGDQVTWPAAALEVGTCLTRTLTVAIADPWPLGATPVLTNTARVIAEGVNGTDTAPASHIAIDTTRVLPHAVYLPLIQRE